MTSVGVGRRLPAPSSVVWVAAGAALSGLATYVLLVLVARALGAAEYGRFSLFWAAIVITSLGVFLPFEQVVARRTAHDTRDWARLRPTSGRLALGAGGVALVVWAVVLVTQESGAGVREHALTVGAFAVACLGFVWQFPSRGVLAGRRDMRGYALVVCVDAIGRAAAVVVLAAAGVRAIEAYVWAVALSALASGLAGRILVGAVHAGADDAESTDPRLGFAMEVGTVVLAMLCMQGLLNSGIVVAGTAGSAADAVVAGHLLAVLSLARLPVFVQQGLQATYVARIARLAHLGSRSQLRRVLVLVGAATSAVCVLWVVGAAAVGPAVIRLVFGPDYDVSRGMVTLVAAGVAAYLIAAVSNDVAVALGAHRVTGPSWLVGLAVGAVVALVTSDLSLRSVLPLLVGAATTAVILGVALATRVRRVLQR